jgi:phosphate starvation-inducible membrane PsiE
MSTDRVKAANRGLHTVANAFGTLLVDLFHYLALFAIGAAVVWSAGVALAVLLLALATLVIRYGSSRFPANQADDRA